MSDKFFLDTNIFVYSFDSGSPSKRDRALQLIRTGLSTGQSIVSYQVIQEFFNVALRRFAPPMSVPEAQQYLSSVFRPMFAIHSSPALYFEALGISEKHAISWYDSLILAAAIAGECAVLYSEDFEHGRKFEHLTIESPFA
jgi:predicted nucleic acid-binding protein